MAQKALSFKVAGVKEALRAFEDLGPRATKGAAMMLKNFADTQIVKPAKEEYVPVDTGNLKASIHAEAPVVTDTTVSITVAAGGPAAPYALNVHENPRAGQTGGVSPQGKKYRRASTVGQWKFLETPALLAAANSRQWLADEASAIMKGMKGK